MAQLSEGGINSKQSERKLFIYRAGGISFLFKLQDFWGVEWEY